MPTGCFRFSKELFNSIIDLCAVGFTEGEGSLAPFPLASGKLQKVRIVYDADARVSAPPQQIVVPRDNVISPGAHRAFEDAVIRRVFFNHVQLHRRRGRSGRVGNDGPCLCYFLRRCGEVSRQHVTHFIEDGGGDRQVRCALQPHM